MHIIQFKLNSEFLNRLICSNLKKGRRKESQVITIENVMTFGEELKKYIFYGQWTSVKEIIAYEGIFVRFFSHTITFHYHRQFSFRKRLSHIVESMTSHWLTR